MVELQKLRDYKFRVLFDKIPNQLLDMPLLNMRCKHVLRINKKEEMVMAESNNIGYMQCKWGSHSGRTSMLEHISRIKDMETDQYDGAVRIVICNYFFSGEIHVWIDNLHTAIKYIRKYGKDVCLKQIPFYLVDLTQELDAIIGYQGSLHTNGNDMIGAIYCGHKRKERSNSPRLIALNYTISDFCESNPELLSDYTGFHV